MEARVSSRGSRLTNVSSLSQTAPQILAVFLANFQLQGNVPQNVWRSSTPLAVGEMTGPSSPRATRWETVGFQEAAEKGRGMEGKDLVSHESTPLRALASHQQNVCSEGRESMEQQQWPPLGRKTREHIALLYMGHLRHLFCPCVYLMQVVKHAMIVFPSTPRKLEICFFFLKREDFYSKTKSYYVAQASHHTYLCRSF